MEKPRILIVEDDQDVAFLLRDILETNGFVCQIESEGEQLVTQEFTRPDLILLDIRLPGIDGYTICRRLKKKAGTRDVPVIFITALNTEDDVVEAKDAGGLFFISKPFDIEFLLKKVKEVLSGLHHDSGPVRIVKKVLCVNTGFNEAFPAQDPLTRCLAETEFNLTVIIDPREIIRKAKLIHPDIIMLDYDDTKLPLSDLADVLSRHRTTRYAALIAVREAAELRETYSREIPGIAAELTRPFICVDVVKLLRSVV